MSKVGNIEKMYGNNFGFVTSNATADTILNSKDRDLALVSSSLIITSPLNEKTGEDKGTPSLIMTDYEGNSLRLTYTISAGNGLVVDSENPDVIQLSIDKSTIITKGTNGPLTVNTYNLVNGQHGSIKTDALGYLVVNTDNICDGEKLVSVYETLEDNKRDYLTINAYSLIDNIYLKCNEDEDQSIQTSYKNQKITVDLPALVDNNTIIADGTDVKRLKVQAKQLSPATSTEHGVVKIDNSTIKKNPNGQIYVDSLLLRKISASGGPGLIYVDPETTPDSKFYGDNNGRLNVKMKNLPKCMNQGDNNTGLHTNGFGVVKADGSTITSNAGVIKVNTDQLSAPNGSKKGVVSVDNKTIKHNGGKIYVTTDGLDKANTVNFGTVRIDGDTITLNSNGQICAPTVENLKAELNTRTSQIMHLQNELAILKNNFYTFFNQSNANMPKFEITLNNNLANYIALKAKVPTVASPTQLANRLLTLNNEFSVTATDGIQFKYTVKNTNSNGISLNSIKIISAQDTSGKTYKPNENFYIAKNSRFKFIFEIPARQNIGDTTIIVDFYTVTNNSQNIPLKTLTIDINMIKTSTSGLPEIFMQSEVSNLNTTIS